MDQQITQITVKIIYELVELYKRLNNNEEKGKVKEMMKEMLKKYTDLLVPNISQKAQEAYTTRNLPKASKNNLREYRWKEKNKLIDINGEKVFFYEHIVPVAVLVENCLLSQNESEVKDIIEKSRTAWITVDENQRLENAKLNHSMCPKKKGRTLTKEEISLEDPTIRYKKTGITLVFPCV